MIKGEPVPKGRPRFAVRGKFAQVYTPKQTKDAENNILRQIIKEMPEKPWTGPLRISVSFFKVKPQSYSKQLIHWTKKPDIDNLLKLVLDALNGVFFVDDAQIIEIKSSKQYDEIARTEITLESI